jgi:hypothetical protein
MSGAVVFYITTGRQLLAPGDHDERRDHGARRV